MKNIFDKLSFSHSRQTTRAYSTSFSMAVRLLSPGIRKHIHNIYGFVRLADEIVDSFHDYPQKEMLDRFEDEYRFAYQHGISSNPIINAFVTTMHKYRIDQHLVNAFLSSMRADLNVSDYTDQAAVDQYIYGSADVVGLMCLKVFVNGNQEHYEELKSSAMKLGSAFQKVNFLRDLKNDLEILHRSYFPSVDLSNLTPRQKEEIIEEIRKDFQEALVGIKQLPANSRKGVYVAFKYYYKLFKKLERAEAQTLMQRRIRISNASKVLVVLSSDLRMRINSF